MALTTTKTSCISFLLSKLECLPKFECTQISYLYKITANWCAYLFANLIFFCFFQNADGEEIPWCDQVIVGTLRDLEKPYLRLTSVSVLVYFTMYFCLFMVSFLIGLLFVLESQTGWH